ncbi:sugar ABC transporter substrate-binding protein [Arthrobacter sp. ISL-5]|uniref:sugar ABC transporter substrate-binding protein n=1 Tax=Arthrobacter sp. ISL-5 TaxID=2819111 RepID=UPI0027E20392|nr:sugar ABC transporter substrate-binding protein [Arthrobacter sp. ISL-5]
MMLSHKARKVAVLGVAAALLMTGCGRDAGSPAGSAASAAPIASGQATGTITVWAQADEGAALPQLAKDFEAANPGVKVNVTAVPWDAAHNKYQTAIAGGTTPDVAQMGTTWMSDFSDAFEPVPAEVDTTGIFPGALKATEVAGTHVGVPWYVDTRVVYYRSDLAAQAGYDSFPTTWDGFKSLAKDLQTKAGAKYGVALPTGIADDFQSMLPFPWSNGAQLVNADSTKWTLDTPEMVGALKYFNSFFQEGIANKTPATGAGAAEAAFVNGSVPMLIAGPSEIGQLDKAGGPGFADKYKVGMIPKEKSATSFVGGSDLVVFKKTQNRDTAWKFIQYLSQPEVQLKFHKLTGDLPAKQAAWTDTSLSGDAKLTVFGNQLKDTNSPPAITTWTQVSAAADTQLEQIVKAGKDPAAALTELQSTADSAGTGH